MARRRAPIIAVRNAVKTYAGGFTALQDVSLSVNAGEILALLGPNGAGKTTLINTICGNTTLSSGSITVGGFDIMRDYRKTRSLIGLVPQELATDAFETVWNTVRFSRGLFGKPPNPSLITRILKDLSLWEKKDAMIMMLSGGMKRRVMIAKALSHEPDILFLDEPTAGVDVALRKGMWRIINRLRSEGCTIILTTHYIEEAEEIADRIAIVDKGRIPVIEDKASLMKRMGKKRMVVELQSQSSRTQEFVTSLNGFDATVSENGLQIEIAYDPEQDPESAQKLVAALHISGLPICDIQSKQDSLESIFVDMTGKNAAEEKAKT
jgi:ABC-2 type transport system ATP-binding protein